MTQFSAKKEIIWAFPKIKMNFVKILFHVLAIIIYKTASNEVDLATNYHDLGVKSAMAGDYVTSLGYLRAACRLKPMDNYFWNDLGVTEMRSGDYPRAMKRFLKSLEIQSDYRVAIDNLNSLKSYLSSKEFARASIPQTFPQLHRLKMLHEVDPFYGSLRKTEYYRAMKFYELLKSPFVIKKGLQHWGWNISDISVEFLMKQFGNESVDYYPQNMIYENVRPYRATLMHALKSLTKPTEFFLNVDASEPGTYIHWNMGPKEWSSLMHHMRGSLPSILDDDFWTTQCFASSESSKTYHLNTHWKMLLIGEGNSGMFNHKDSLQSSSFQLQLVGRKKWHICDSSQDPYMYHAGNINTFNPDYEMFPEFKKANCYQYIAEPGDVIYYPKDYWHQTLNLDTPTIALTGTLVTPDNYHDLQNRLTEQCQGAGTIFLPDPELCRQLKDCFRLWKEYFDTTKSKYPLSLPGYCDYHNCDALKYEDNILDGQESELFSLLPDESDQMVGFNEETIKSDDNSPVEEYKNSDTLDEDKEKVDCLRSDIACIEKKKKQRDGYKF